MSSPRKPDTDWNARWHDAERTTWHCAAVNEHLIKYYDRLLEGANAHRKQLNVFVPLCGKTVDMMWLKERGHHILGVELVRKALDDFVSENKLPSTVSSVKNGDGEELTLIKAGEKSSISLFPSDLFNVDCVALGQVDAVWDRGSYVALEAEFRPRYADYMASVVKPGGRLLMETYDYVQAEHPGPPFSTPNDEIVAAFGSNFTVEFLMKEDILKLFQETLGYKLRTFCDRGMALLVRNGHAVESGME
ncbi:thiopurine S-methyltransferase-like [Sycon ciliatum]|uniref:thiopurine S-methyltransferase-like n=1 Tax=Sycon ciliatum TaxID=27933 RepID=UPI0031F6CA42